MFNTRICALCRIHRQGCWQILERAQGRANMPVNQTILLYHCWLPTAGTAISQQDYNQRQLSTLAKKKKKEILYGFAMASLPKTQPLQRSSNNRVNQDVLRPPLFSSCFILHLESWITKLIITVSLLPISSVFLPTVLLQAGREATQPCVKPGNYSSVIIATKGNRQPGKINRFLLRHGRGKHQLDQLARCLISQ